MKFYELFFLPASLSKFKLPQKSHFTWPASFNEGKTVIWYNLCTACDCFERRPDWIQSAFWAE